MPADCPRLWEVDAYRQGRLGERDAERFERHARTCAGCAGRLERDDRLRELARRMPDREPDELALRRVRSDVMRGLATGPSSSAPRRWPFAAAVALALVGAIGWAAVSRPKAPRAERGPAAPRVASAAAPDSLAGSVLALTPSQWTQARSDGVERVAMQGGWLRVHVRPQAAGERFLVTMPDGEIEVRGTTFDVAVDGASTTRVHVDDGVVELRLNGLAAERLGPGSTWPPPAPAAVPALPPTAGNSAPSPTTRPPASTSPGVVDRAASAYRDAMQLLLEGHDADAASAFAAFVVAHPGAPQVEDASYLEAVALARAGRVDAAALAAEQYLRRFPKAFHGKEAAALAVRAASLRGDCVHVRALVAAWSAGEPDPDERAALKVCEGR